MASQQQPPRLVIVQDHGDVLPHWWVGAGASVLHVDKHDDLEMPESSFSSCENRSGLRNNNFIMAAISCGHVSRVLWLHPEFQCMHCNYAGSEQPGIHRCQLGTAHGGQYVVRPTDEAMQRRQLDQACGASSKEWALTQPRAAHSFELAVFGVTSFARDVMQDNTHPAGGLRRSEAASQFEGWFGASGGGSAADAARPGYWAAHRPWILDLDLDYFVDDSEAPKMRGPPDVDFDEAGTLLHMQCLHTHEAPGAKRRVHTRGLGTLTRQLIHICMRTHVHAGVTRRFHPRGLRKLLHFSKNFPGDSLVRERFENMLSYEIYTPAPPPVPLTAERLQARLSSLEIALRQLTSLDRPPAVITIVRSNVGGYTPVEQTAWLEEEVLSFLRRLYPSAARSTVEYAGEWTLNGSATAALGQMLRTARRKHSHDHALKREI